MLLFKFYHSVTVLAPIICAAYDSNLEDSIFSFLLSTITSIFKGKSNVFCIIFSIKDLFFVCKILS